MTVSMISYTSSRWAYVAIRGGGGYLVDNGVSAIAHSEPFLRRNAAWLRASPTKLPELKDRARCDFEKVELDENSGAS